MKAISLHQPWASAIAFGVKHIETRSWATRHRGPIAIHAAKNKDPDNCYLFGQFINPPSAGGSINLAIHAAFREHMTFDFGDFNQLDFGAIVAVANLVDCLPITDDLSSPCLDKRVNMTDAELILGNYNTGRYAWLLADVRRIVDAIPCKGRQGIFNIPDSLLPHYALRPPRLCGESSLNPQPSTLNLTMTKPQTSLYWRSWAAAKKAARLDDEDRHALHIQTLGHDKSSRDFTNADLDKILATFRALSHPASLNTQLRQQEQPNTRKLYKIAALLKCLGLFVADPVAYMRAILRDRFHAALLEDLARADLNAQIINAQSSMLNDEPQSLDQLIFTLTRCLSSLRRKTGPPGEALSEHDMCRRAGVDCFRPDCAQCRATGSARVSRARSGVSPEPINTSRQPAETPF